MKHTLVFHTVKLGKQIQKTLGYKSFPHSLGYSQAQTLILIYSQDQINQKEIAAALRIEPASVVKIIDELEKFKLVKRIKNNGDRRQFQIIITPKGKAEIAGIAQKTQNLEKLLKTSLSEKEALTFMQIAEKITTELENYSKGGEINK